MRNLLFVVLLLAIAPTPVAAERVTVPEGWTSDERHAERIETHMLAELPPGLIADLHASSYRSREPGGQLIVSTLTSKVTGDGGGFVRGRIDELRTTGDAVAAGGNTVRTLAWKEHRADDTQAEATLEWADDGLGTRTLVRALWIRPQVPDSSIEEYRVECVLAESAAARLRPLCEQALASLTPSPRARLPFRLVAAAPPAADEPDEDAPAPPPAAAAPAAGQPTIGEAPATTGPILARRPVEKKRDWRPFLVGGAILIVLAAVWAGRRRRNEVLAKLEAEEAARVAAKTEAPSPPAPDDEASS